MFPFAVCGTPMEVLLFGLIKKIANITQDHPNQGLERKLCLFIGNKISFSKRKLRTRILFKKVEEITWQNGEPAVGQKDKHKHIHRLHIPESLNFY